jgi:pentatricopeptide repeat protein
VGACILALGAAPAFAQPARGHADAPPEPRPEASASDGRGLPETEADCPVGPDFGGSPLEQAAFCALLERKFVSVRSLAKRALAEDPQSPRALFLLGVAQHQGEGNLPKALHHLQRADESFERRHGGAQPEEPSLFKLRVRILFELMDVHGEMDHHQERIHYAEAIAELTREDYLAYTAWPLMKLGRFEEARAVVEAALESEERSIREMARTSLCAIESELRNRARAYEACKQAAEPVKGRSRGGAVELTNAGAASEEMLRFDEAERFYLEAARRPPETAVNPWGRLVHLYLSQGRFSEALSAWREMRSYRARRPLAYFDQQDEAEALLAGATLLLVAGRAELAEPVVARVVDRPDRQGTSSAASDQTRAGSELVAHVVRRVRARMLEEEAELAPLLESLELEARAAKLRFEAWLAGRRAKETLAKPERLVTTLRPEVPGSLELPGWLDAEVIGLVGPGVARVAIEKARAQETLPEDATRPVFSAYLAEAAWLDGDLRAALRLGEEAVASAGRGFTMVAARAAAIAAAAATELGEHDRARTAFRQALERDPGVLRLLEIPLPVRLKAVGGERSRAAAERLADVPALSPTSWGFELAVGDRGARLRGLDGSELLQVRVPPPEEDDAPEDPVRYLASQVQRRLLVPLVDITQVDVRSLEGGLGRGTRASDAFDVLEEGR